MKIRSYKFLILILAVLFILLGNSCNTNAQSQAEIEVGKQQTYAKLEMKADSALAYCKAKGLNTDYCILVDFSIHSGCDRMFVWDFQQDSIKYEGLCCHGAGKRSTPTHPVFSNEEGSLCSSLGHYKVASRYVSDWGINVGYQLKGLDSTNSNALKRAVTLHSHTPVASQEIYPRHLPMGYSHGCTVISNLLMTNLDELLKNNKNPMLLWIYE